MLFVYFISTKSECGQALWVVEVWSQFVHSSFRPPPNRRLIPAVAVVLKKGKFVAKS